MSKTSLSPSTCCSLPKATVLTAVIAFTLLTFAPQSAQAAETCATAPTCAELGYTLTSTTNCVGTPLKCPFDKTKFYCTQKQDAAAAAMPDYSKAVRRSTDALYTAETNGFIMGYQRFISSNRDDNFHVYINDINVRITTSQADYSFDTWSYPVKKGNTYRVTGAGDNAPRESQYYFVPSN